MMCVNTVGASKLLGVARGTLYLWRLDDRFSEIHFNGRTYIPIRDIAKDMKITQRELIDMADDMGVPLWRVKE